MRSAQNKQTNLNMGIVNLSIEECEKHSKISKLYIEILKKFNRSNMGRKIPIREFRDCSVTA
jgi:hypothetical protein